MLSGEVTTAREQSLAASRKAVLSLFDDSTPAPGSARAAAPRRRPAGEAVCRRDFDGAGVGQRVGRKERYARDADYRARESARRRAYHRTHKQEISVRRQGGHLKRRYGISRADYAALLARQGGVCAICGKPPEKTLCVDHCHLTGRIRGLLCRKCNFGLGCYAEDQAAMIAALAYLGHGAFDGGGSGSAAQRALLARAALPASPTRIAVLTEAHIRFDAAPLARAAGIGRMTSALRLTTRDGALLPTNSIHVQLNGGHMSICDVPPDGGKAARPMWEALAAELRRESDDGSKADILRLIARKLAAKALEGDLGAIKEIFDRMDGKSVAGTAPDEPPGKVIFQWKDPE
jgi:Recombination endonuclease VII